ncbi:MAG: alpha/beta hydrolase [Clostridia bacterium]|nr:alpha/beta hydrolase [Clostridia bacterium]
MEATFQGCRIHYTFEQNASPEAPVVLLMHGWGCDGTIFSYLQRELAPQSSVLTLDFPGHGKSDEPPCPWGVPEYAVLVKELLDSLKIEQVNAVAHSFGGRVAIELASSYPELIRQLIITGGAGLRKQPTEEQKKRQAQYKRMNGLLEKLKKLPLLGRLAEVLQTKLRNKYGSADYIKLNENMRKTFVKVINYDQAHLLEKIQSSTLLIWGSADTETPLWMGQQMEKDIPDAALITFDGRGHFAFAEEYPRFAIIAKQFFFGGDNR